MGGLKDSMGFHRILTCWWENRWPAKMIEGVGGRAEGFDRVLQGIYKLVGE